MYIYRRICLKKWTTKITSLDFLIKKNKIRSMRKIRLDQAHREKPEKHSDKKKTNLENCINSIRKREKKKRKKDVITHSIIAVVELPHITHSSKSLVGTFILDNKPWLVWLFNLLDPTPLKAMSKCPTFPHVPQWSPRVGHSYHTYLHTSSHP